MSAQPRAFVWNLRVCFQYLAHAECGFSESLWLEPS
ncbi:hypothetical protein ABH917_004158 [Thermobifida halotolerans]